MAGLTKEKVQAYLESVDVQSPLEKALNAAVSALAPEPTKFFGEYFGAVAAGTWCAGSCPNLSSHHPPAQRPHSHGARRRAAHTHRR